MKRTYNPGETECEGTCGRQLRSSRKTLAQRPGTVVRFSSNMCQRCFNAAKAPEQQVKPCSNCQHPTRPQRLTAHDAPGTLKRIGTLCQRCHNNCEVVPADVSRAAESLEAYLRARRARGVPAEGRCHLDLAA